MRFKNPPTLCLRSYLIPFTARSQNPVVIVTYDESSAPLAPLPLTFSTVGAKALFGVGISGSGAGRRRNRRFLLALLPTFAAIGKSRSLRRAKLSKNIAQTKES